MDSLRLIVLGATFAILGYVSLTAQLRERREERLAASLARSLSDLAAFGRPFELLSLAMMVGGIGLMCAGLAGSVGIDDSLLEWFDNLVQWVWPDTLR
jgi:hypothetical protein